MNPIVTIQIPGRGQPQGETVEIACKRVEEAYRYLTIHEILEGRNG